MLIRPLFTATVAKHSTTNVLTAAGSVEFGTQKCFERLRTAILKSLAVVTCDGSHGSQLTGGSQAFSRNRASNTRYETDVDVVCSVSSFGMQLCHLVVDNGVTLVAF